MKPGMDRSTEYGETLGKEYYMYFGDFNCRHGSMHNRDLSNVLRYAYYKEKMYYVKDDYLWRSNEDGSMPEIIRERDFEWRQGEIFVNACGIYLIADSRCSVIAVYDLDGNKKAVLEPYDEVQSYYICDNRVYMITYDKCKIFSAVWIDVDTQTRHMICTTGREGEAINSRCESCIKSTSMKYIMANRKRVLIWMEFVNLFYPEDESMHCHEIKAAGWYSYSLENEKLTSINSVHMELQPCMDNPKHFIRKWDEDILDREDEWYPIAFFDMGRDMMWKKEVHSDIEIWKPREIGNVASSEHIRSMPSWRVKGIPNGWRVFFNGIHRLLGYPRGLRAYNTSGELSSSLTCSDYSDADCFQICGDYVFCVNDMDMERQFSIDRSLSGSSLRPGWMYYHSPLSDDAKRAIEKFTKGKKIQSSPMTSSAVTKESHVDKGVDEKTQYLTYWEKFAEYTSGNVHNKEFQDAGFSQARPTDRNWHALRFGTSQAHIELSFNTKKGTARTALFIRDKKKYCALEARKEEINNAFRDINGTMAWDGVSKLPSIGIIREKFDISDYGPEQFDWFMQAASIFKALVASLV